MCWDSSNSHEYNGNLSVTENGRECQPWSSQYPHSHSYAVDSNFPEGSVEAAANYCRDPGGDGFLWCLTTDIDFRWEHCIVLPCSYQEGTMFLEYYWQCRGIYLTLSKILNAQADLNLRWMTFWYVFKAITQINLRSLMKYCAVHMKKLWLSKICLVKILNAQAYLNLRWAYIVHVIRCDL